MARGGWGINEGYVEAALRDAGRRIGLNEHEVEATIRSAAKTAQARELKIGA
jgi:hypothetical protein